MDKGLGPFQYSILIFLKDPTHSEPDVTEKHLPNYEKRENNDEDDDKKMQGGQHILVCYKCLYFLMSDKEL